jgi:hypothetical protein
MKTFLILSLANFITAMVFLIAVVMYGFQRLVAWVKGLKAPRKA